MYVPYSLVKYSTFMGIIDIFTTSATDLCMLVTFPSTYYSAENVLAEPNDAKQTEMRSLSTFETRMKPVDF